MGNWLLLTEIGTYTIFKAWEVHLHLRQVFHLENMLKNKNHPNREIYKEVTEIDEEALETSIRYSRTRAIFGTAKTWSEIFINLFMLGLIVRPKIWQIGTVLLPSSIKNNEYAASLTFVFLTAVIEKIISLPWALYSDFVIEEKFGFNNKTLKLFFLDIIKEFFLLILFGFPCYAALIFLINWGGKYFFIYATAGMVTIMLIMTFIYPEFIAPMFNKYEKLQNIELEQKINQLASNQKFPLKKIFQVDASKRSGHSNAYMYGFGAAKRLVLYDTLLQNEHSQILAIVAHEIGHWKHGDTIKQMVLMAVHTAAIFFLYSLVRENSTLYQSFGWGNNRSVVVGISLFMELFFPVEQIIQFLMSIISRKAEYAADKFAHMVGYNKSLQKGLISISKQNKVGVAPDRLYAAWYSSHPSLIERLNALKKLESKTN